MLGALLIYKCLKLKIKCFRLGHMVGGMTFFWYVVVCLGQQGPNILGVLLSKQICVLTTLETYGTSLDLVLWRVLASGRWCLGVVFACALCIQGMCCVCGRIVVGTPLQGASSILRSMVISSLSKELTPHQHMGVSIPIWTTRS